MNRDSTGQDDEDDLTIQFDLTSLEARRVQFLEPTTPVGPSQTGGSQPPEEFSPAPDDYADETVFYSPEASQAPRELLTMTNSFGPTTPTIRIGVEPPPQILKSEPTHTPVAPDSVRLVAQLASSLERAGIAVSELASDGLTGQLPDRELGVPLQILLFAMGIAPWILYRIIRARRKPEVFKVSLAAGPPMPAKFVVIGSDTAEAIVAAAIKNL